VDKTNGFCRLDEDFWENTPLVCTLRSRISKALTCALNRQPSGEFLWWQAWLLDEILQYIPPKNAREAWINSHLNCMIKHFLKVRLPSLARFTMLVWEERAGLWNLLERRFHTSKNFLVGVGLEFVIHGGLVGSFLPPICGTLTKQ